MPPYSPPSGPYRGSANRRVIPAGTAFWRVHREPHAPVAFKDEPADRHVGGGRFDATVDDRYPFLYAALAESTALAETLTRDLAFVPGRKRIVTRRAVSGRRLSELRTTADLTLLSLVSAKDLAVVQQDSWLAISEARDYHLTRQWGHWLRREFSWAQGLIWSTRRDLTEVSMVLFGDRCPPGALRVTDRPTLALDDEKGAAELNDKLADYGAYVYPPRVRAPGR